MSERRSLVLSGGRVAELPATDVLPGVHRYHGFPQPYQVSLSYSAANRQITITPSGATFDIWVQGVRYVKTGAQVSTAHANSSGNYYIYYAADGTLTTSTDPWDLTTVSPVAYIYYNASLVDALVLFELHTAERNTEWHLSQHYAIGTFVRSGLEISGYTLNSTANTAKTYAIASGIIVDEDIEYDVTGVADGGPYTILYRSGASDWAWTTTDSYPFKIGTTYIQYNQNNAGSYQLTELGNNTYMNYWVFATTALSANKQIFIVPSQTYHTSLVNAQAEAITSLSWGGLSLPEIAAIWKITYEAKSSYLTAAGRVQMVEVVKISATRSQISGNFSAGTHNALSGRDFADCHPASAIAYTAHGDLPTETVQFVISSLEDRKQEGGYVLDAFNTLTPAADKVPYFTGSGTAALATLTAAGRALLDDADAAAQRTTLSVRELLTAARTYYVATTGSDSNDGLSAGSPFLTIQKAVDVVCSIDSGVYAVTISVADGTYAGAVALKAPVGSGTFTLQGNTSTPANCVISPASGSAITANGAGKWTVKGVKLTTTSAGRGIIALGSSTQLSISYIEFGSVNYEHIYLSNGAALSIGGAWAISGSAIAHILVSSGGQFNAGGITCTITNTPAFSNGFATASNLGVIVVVSLTFSGSATGKRYDATTNGVIQTYGGGASYFPGNASGTTATGGVYA